MNLDLTAAMRAAMIQMRGQKLAEATRIIQGALSGREPGLGESPCDATATSLPIEGQVIDLTAEIIEPEIAARPALQADPKLESQQPPKIADWKAGLVGKTLAKLRHAELPRFSLDGLKLPGARKVLEIPDGAQFLSRSFRCAAGTRDYKLYIPRRPRRAKRALIIMLHGGTQDADDFAAGTRMNALAEKHGFIVAYPNQSKAANASMCWNWFRPEDQMRGSGEPAIIAGITGEIIAQHDIDTERVYIAGLSAGGAMAAVMASTYPELYAAVGVHSGLAYRSAADVVSAFAAMRGNADLPLRNTAGVDNPGDRGDRVPTILFHGDADAIVHPSNAEKIVRAQTKTGDMVEHMKTRSIGGRSCSRSIIRDQAGSPIMATWLIHGSGHAWSGGSADGTYTDPHGPDASREMVEFFLGQ